MASQVRPTPTPRPASPRSFVRTTTLFVKRWKERYARLVDGRLWVFESRAAMMAGDEPVEVIDLSQRMALSSMKVHTGGPAPRIFYRHIAELAADVALTGQASAAAADALEDSDSTRVFKFGASSQVRGRADDRTPFL